MGAATGTHLRKGRGDELALALPLVALGRDEVGPVREQDLVGPHGLGEARARADHFLCAGVERRREREEGEMRRVRTSAR